MNQITDTTQLPYAAIGLLEIQLENGTTGWGTGSLINERYVLTCSHNMLSRKSDGTQYRAKRIIFYPGYTSSSRPQGGGVEVDAGFYSRAYREQNDQSWDIGVLRLKSNVYLKSYMQPTPLQSDPPTNLLLTGYPGDRHYQMWSDTETFAGVNLQEHCFAYTHTTHAGSSGSPIYSTSGSNAFQYAVHTLGESDGDQTRVGVLITPVTYALIDAAMKAPTAEYFLNPLG